jgi:hypothetical protein
MDPPAKTEEPPDFAYIDRMVKEYIAFREQPPCADCSPDETVEKIMKAFDTGDYPNVLFLWDSWVSQKLSLSDPVVVHEAAVAEFYMHIHCATSPFRQTTIAQLPNPVAAAKLAARSMTIFRHYVETKGKALAATPEFHVYKHLHKIAFPPTHPKYSHLFYQDWMTRTREAYFKFLIPFLRDTQYPALCAALASAASVNDDFAPASKSPDQPRQLEQLKERERHTAKVARQLFEAASDFVDLITEDGRSEAEAVSDIQGKLKELGKALLPHSPSHSPGQSLAQLDSMASEYSVDTLGGKKKKRHRRKARPHYDYTLIGADLSSMTAELTAEISKHLQSGVSCETQSLSVDMDMATQSALQGCLLIKALRHLINAEEHKPPNLEHTAASVHETIPENGFPTESPPSPRSKGGSVDKIIVAMAQGDLLGVTARAEEGGGGEGEGAEGAEGAIAAGGPTALPFEVLLDAFMQAAQHIREIPLVEEPGEAAAGPGREDKMLMDTLAVSRYFVEDYISLVAHVCTSVSGVQYLADSNTGTNLYAKIIKFLLQLKPVQEDMMVKLHVVCLCTMITIGHRDRHCLETFVRAGGPGWMAATLDGLLRLGEEEARTLPGHEDYLDLCMGLLHQVLREAACRRLLFEAPDSRAAASAIAFLLVNLIATQTGKLRDEAKAVRASTTPPAEILFYLLENTDTRNAVRYSAEVTTLKELVAEIEQDEGMEAKLVSVRSVLRNIDAGDVSTDASSSVSDLVYSVGVRNLVSDMLCTLPESEEVLKYREENASYSTNNYILEKYKLSQNQVGFSPT